MESTTIRLLKWDCTLQFRHGLYYIYLGVTALYILIILQIPGDLRKEVAAVTILSDPSVLGFFMIGGLVLFERDSNIISGLFVTPLPFHSYFLSKTFSLTFLSLIASLCIALAAGAFGWGILWLLLGVLFTSGLFLIIGFTAVSLVPTLNWYLISSGGYMAIFALPPILYYAGVIDHYLWNLLPTRASLVLIRGAFFSLPAAEGITALLSLVIWSIALYFPMKKVYMRSVMR